jgi:hypothetical protein
VQNAVHFIHFKFRLFHLNLRSEIGRGAIPVTLQTLLAGLGGLNITNNGVEQKFTLTLPKAWEKLVLKGIGGEETEFVIE